MDWVGNQTRHVRMRGFVLFLSLLLFLLPSRICSLNSNALCCIFFSLSLPLLIFFGMPFNKQKIKMIHFFFLRSRSCGWFRLWVFFCEWLAVACGLAVQLTPPLLSPSVLSATVQGHQPGKATLVHKTSKT